MADYDVVVVVVGAGNSAMAAAVSARGQGAHSSGGLLVPGFLGGIDAYPTKRFQADPGRVAGASAARA
jgi:hypothetical protein